MHDKLKEILVEKEREVQKLREAMPVFDWEVLLLFAISGRHSLGREGPQ